MTAVNSRKTKLPVLKKNPERDRGYTGLPVYRLVAFVAARAVWADIPLAVLAVVFTAAEKDSLRKAFLARGALVSFGLMCVSDMAYMPYLVCCAVYTVLYNVTGKSRISLGVALGVMIAAKLVTGRHISPFGYRVYPFLEAGGAWILTNIIDNTKDIYNPDAAYTASWDIAMIFTAGLAVTLAFSGGDSHRIYPGVAVAFAVSVLYIGRQSVVYSVLALLCSLVAAADKKAFPILFAAIVFMWLVVSVTSEKNRKYVLPAIILPAFIINIAFLPATESFSLLGTALCSGLFYILLPDIVDMKKIRRPELFRQDRDFRQIMNGMQKLEESLNYLGNCAIDISKLNEKNLVSHSLEDTVAEDVCRRCSFSAHCWQEKYSFTSRQFAKYAKGMNWQGENDFDIGFYSQCRHTDRLKKSFEENSRILLSRRYILQSQKNNQQLLQGAFMAVAARVGDLIYQNQTGNMVNSSVTTQLDSFLFSINLPHSYCLCTQNPDRAVFAVMDEVPETELYKIHSRLENIYGEKFTMEKVNRQGGEYIYSFFAAPVYSYEKEEKNRPYKDINGDSTAVIPIQDRLYVLISDGMGTGSAAAAESKTVIAMARSLLGAGIRPDNIITIVNLAMNLRGSGEGGATMDMLCIDLQTGRTTLLKAGASPTVVINKSGLERYYGDSLPLGVVKEAKFYSQEFLLESGDTVIMATDGVGNTGRNIQNLYSQPCREIASYVLNENKTMDDKTAVVIRLKKRA